MWMGVLIRQRRHKRGHLGSRNFRTLLVSFSRYIVVGLHNGGLVVFNVNFNCWREKIRDGGDFKDHQPEPSLRRPILQEEEVAEGRKEMEPSSSPPNPHTNTEEDGSKATTAPIETAEQEEIKSSEMDIEKNRPILLSGSWNCLWSLEFGEALLLFPLLYFLSFTCLIFTWWCDSNFLPSFFLLSNILVLKVDCVIVSYMYVSKHSNLSKVIERYRLIFWSLMWT